MLHMSRVCIYLLPEMKAELNELAKMQHIPFAEVVRRAVADYLAREGAAIREEWGRAVNAGDCEPMSAK